MSQSLRELAADLVEDRLFERALAVYAEAVRRSPDDHRARMGAAQCYAELGEKERAVMVLHACAEGLLRRDYLLSAIAACRSALRFSPQERRVKDTLARIHSRAMKAPSGRAAVPPPRPPDVLFDGKVETDLMALAGEALSDAALEVLAAPDLDGPPADPDARPPLPLFAELNREAFVELVGQMHLRTVKEDRDICVQGEGGESILVLVAGKAEVTRLVGGELKTIGFLSGGSIFGEMAMLTGSPASANVTAVTDCEVLEISRDTLARTARAHPETQAVIAQFAQARMARHLMSTSPLFQRFPEAERAALLQHFSFKALGTGERALKEGDHVQGMYLVLAGELVVQKDDPAGGKVTLGVLREGDIAGEISLLTGLRATATVVATRKTATAFLDRSEFDALLQRFPDARVYLEELSQRRLRQIGDALRPAEIIDADELVVEQDTEAETG